MWARVREQLHQCPTSHAGRHRFFTSNSVEFTIGKDNWPETWRFCNRTSVATATLLHTRDHLSSQRIMNIWRKLTRMLGFMKRTPRRRKARILFVGLNNAGKSTLLNRLKPDREQLSRKLIAPTVGYTTDMFVCKCHYKI